MKTLNYKKALSLLLCFIMTTSLFFTGCSKTHENNSSQQETESVTTKQTENKTEDEITAVDTNTNKSLFSFELFENEKLYTAEELNVQKAFEDYLKEIFIDIYKDSSISVNFLMENPENFEIEKIPSSWGTINMEALKENQTALLKYSEQLNTFPYDALTSEQQYIYDNLKRNLDLENVVTDSFLFSSAFSLDGIISQIPLIMTEYSFHTKADINDYLTLLETLDVYLAQNLEYEHERMKQGYYLSTYSYESTIKQCETFLEQGDDYLANIFKGKLDSFEGLTEQEQQDFLNRNTTAITEHVIPAYHNVIDTLKAYKEEGVCNKGLCHLKNGKEYYNYLLQSSVGTDKTPEDLISILDENIEQYQEDLSKLLLSNLSIYSDLENPQYIYTDPDQILSYLSEMLQSNFPSPACKDYTLKNIDAAMADELSVAFYILSPIDHYQNNIIYVNQDRISEGNDLFPTLAHEGMPGHMYQHNYFSATNPNYFRSLMTFTGYSEGWAQYVELYSYDWSGLDPALAEALKINTLLSDALPTRIDLGVNYEGWTLKETAKYLAKFGIKDTETVKIYYDTVISAPTVFFTYYVGYLELMELKQLAKDTLGDCYNEKDFHKFILEIGPSYFDCIEKAMQNWMNKIQQQAD